ncbi:MAG: hypothetical protein U0271_33330 [Polyangiaceae bacterium]
MHDRLKDASKVASLERNGRTFVLHQWTNEGSVDDIAIAVTGGSHAARTGAGYRGARGGGPLVLTAPVLLRRETSSDRLSKKLKLAIEPELGHPRFDAEVFIHTTASTEEVRALFPDDAAAEAALEALRHFTTLLFGDPKSPIAGVLVTTDEQHLKMEAHEARLDALDTLAAALPELAPARTPFQSLLPVRLLTWGLTYNAVIVAGVYGFVTARPLDGWIILQPLLAGLVLHGILLFVRGRRVVRGRQNAVQSFVALAFTGAVQMCAGLVGATAWANQYFDRSSATTLRAQVVQFTPENEDKDGTLKVQLEGEAGAREISPSFMPAAPCSEMWLTVRAGRFGKRWIERATCAPTGQ